MPKEQNPFEIDFDSYVRQSEPSKQEKGRLWQTAIGLQQVDGLTPSKFLYETAKRNIDGDITIKEAKKLIDSYYESKVGREEINEDEKEADQVSVRIREILAEKTFSFTPDLLLSIHKRLFMGVFYKVKAGSYRTYNISKKEWVLDGESVLYANADMIRQTLDYDFGQEKAFDYSTLTPDEAIKHIARFIANIWQIHPFGEGNTRTTAVFTIKYLNSLGFKVNNEPFEKSSWYFRNAMVRVNYTNMAKGIYMNTEYMEKFFRNMILGESNELKNRYTHIRCNEEIEKSSEKILKLLKENPELSVADISKLIGISSRAAEKQFANLKEKGKIKREEPDKGGKWIVISEDN